MARERFRADMNDVLRRSILASAFTVLLGGCASYAWVNPNVSPDIAANDERSCRLEARDLSMQYAWSAGPWGYGPWAYGPWGRPWGWGGPYGDPSLQAAAEQRVYERCMQGRGYELVRVDKPR